MKILHIILENNARIHSSALNALCETLNNNIENRILTDNPLYLDIDDALPIKYSKWNKLDIRNKFLKILYTEMPDVVHVHGAWSYSQYQCLKMATNRGFITFYTPHNEINTKNIKIGFWKEKLWKLLWYQCPLMRKANFILAHDNKEREILQLLGRKNNVILLDAKTDYAEQIADLYEKTYEDKVAREIDIQTMVAIHKQLHALLHGEDLPMVMLTERGQRQYDIFCRKQGLDKIMQEYHVPRYAEDDCAELIINTMKELKKNIDRQKATFADIFFISSIMQNNDYDEDKVCDRLKRHSLYNFTSRIIQIADELCGVEPGFMPMSGLDDDGTTYIKMRIAQGGK